MGRSLCPESLSHDMTRAWENLSHSLFEMSTPPSQGKMEATSTPPDTLEDASTLFQEQPTSWVSAGWLAKGLAGMCETGAGLVRALVPEEALVAGVDLVRACVPDTGRPWTCCS